MTQDQLQNVVRSALRESVPSLAKNLQTRCTADGQVAVLGNVENFERKLAISQALRRLHGCTVVINKTKVAYDPDGYLARHAAHPPAQTVSNTAPVPAPVGQLPDPNVVVKSGSPGLPPSPPVNIQKPPSITVSPGEAPGSVTPNAPRLSPVQVQQRIKDVCPKAVEVKVSPTANGDLKVEINVREEADCKAILGQIYGISELAALQLRPEFKVQRPWEELSGGSWSIVGQALLSSPKIHPRRIHPTPKGLYDKAQGCVLATLGDGGVRYNQPRRGCISAAGCHRRLFRYATPSG